MSTTPLIPTPTNQVWEMWEGSISSELYSDILKNSNDGLPSSSDNVYLILMKVARVICGMMMNLSLNVLKIDLLKLLSWIGNGRGGEISYILYPDSCSFHLNFVSLTQEGFNIGFKESVLVGRNFGLVRGITSALASLPSGLREKLVETEEKQINFRHLHESSHFVSTIDALKL
ncbi:hypothetical protein Leryth_002171 [Lithospermum erythrorhizon]|nr:hypothetical protein Leryth_002171 [Lithospermum erythrorhizon]